MSRDNFPPRNPDQKPQVRSYSPGGSSGARKDFHVRRIAGATPSQRRGIRRQARIVKRHHEIWIGVALLAIVLVVAGGLWMAGRDRSRGAAAPATADTSDGSDARGVWQGPVPFEVAEKFTSATSHAERLKWVRNPDTVAPLMEEFFREGPGAREKVAQTYPMQPTADGEVLFENFQVVFEDGTYRLLSVSVDPAGARVDFKAYARHGSEKWEDLLSGAAKSADEVRVILSPGGFYAHQFPDEAGWLHFKATTPDLPAFMDFYVARDSEAARELASIEAFQILATVSIRAVGDSASQRQFEITAIKSAGWTTADE